MLAQILIAELATLQAGQQCLFALVILGAQIGGDERRENTAPDFAFERVLRGTHHLKRRAGALIFFPCLVAAHQAEAFQQRT